MCGGDSTTKSKVILPDWVEEGGKANYDLAVQLGNRAAPMSNYTLPRIAGFTPEENAAFSKTNAMQDYWRPAFDTALQTGTNVANARFTDADIGAYMNPYIGNVLDRATQDFMRASGINRERMMRQQTAANSWGDGRIIAGDEYNRSELDTLQRMLAEGYAGAFDRGAAMWSDDQRRALEGANLLIRGGAAGTQLGYNDIDRLLQTGGMKRGMNQANLDLALKDYLEAYNQPIQGLNLRMAALAGTPYAQEQTSSGSQPAGSGIAQGIGAAGTLIGGLGTIFGGSDGGSAFDSSLWDWIF